MKSKVYLETTIVSYLVASSTNDLIQAAHQQVTARMVDAPRAVHSVRIEARPDRGWSGRRDSGRPPVRDIGRYSSAVSRPRGDDTRKHSDPDWHTAYEGTARRGARGDRRRERYG